MRHTAAFLLIVLSSMNLLAQGIAKSGKWITDRDKTVFVIGDKNAVEFRDLHFTVTKPTDDSFMVFTSVRNISPDDITINVLPQQKLGVEPRTFLIRGADSLQIYITTTIPAGKINEVIRLESTEWGVDLELDGFGYQLSTGDFEKPDKKQIPGNFYYFRTGDEYQLEISAAHRKKAPKYIPLSKQLVNIEFNKGTYLLTIVGPSGRKSKEIEIE